MVTGEGSLDEQSLAGKAPVGVLVRSRAVGVPVVAVAGRSLLPAADARSVGFASVLPLRDWEPDVQRSLAHAATLLEQVGAHLAAEWLP